MSKDIGRYGEQLAALYLNQNEYQVVESNFHSRFGEIDIVARTGSLYVFVEVKTRTSDRCGAPEESIDHRKIIKIYKTAMTYLEAISEDKTNINWRVDLIAIKLGRNKKLVDIKHYKNIFLP